jgi:hypothetical protein
MMHVPHAGGSADLGNEVGSVQLAKELCEVAVGRF